MSVKIIAHLLQKPYTGFDRCFTVPKGDKWAINAANINIPMALFC
jgi:hypothetical protein